MAIKYEKVSDSELVQKVQEEAAAADYSGTNTLSFQREASTRSYNGQLSDGLQPTTGRSSLVNNKIQPAVETLTTHLTNIFCSDMETVVFTPTSKDVKEAAMQTTSLVNHIIHKQNPGYDIISQWIKDAAINKNGIVKIFWDTTPKYHKEHFEGTELELKKYLSDKEAEGYDCEVIEKLKIKDISEITDESTGEVLEVTEEKTEYVLKVSKPNGKVCIENIPPEEFLINEGATRINNDPKTRFVAHRQVVSISEILANPLFEGISEEELASNGIQGYLEYEFEKTNRHSGDQTYEYSGTTPSDGPNRHIELIETWIACDRDGDGIAEWRHVFTTGNTLLFDEEWFGDIPFASFTFFPIPHKFYGLSVYDKVGQYHRACSMLLRAETDQRLSNLTTRILANPDQVNIRDLQSERPGVIRVKPGFEAKDIQMIPPVPASGNTLALLEYLHKEITGQIGIDPNLGQVSADIHKSGNDAAKTSQIIDNASAKVEGYAREFAETGLREVIWQVSRLVIEYSDHKSIEKLVSKITPETPELLIAQEDMAEHFDKDDLTARVGLGHQTMQQKREGAQLIIQTQTAMETSPVNPIAIPAKNKIAAANKLAVGLGFDEADEFFPTAEEVKAEQDRLAQQQQAELAQQQQFAQQAAAEDSANNEADRMLKDAKAKEATVKANAAERNQELAEEAKVVDIENVKFDNELNERRQEAQEEQMAANIEMQDKKLEFEYTKLDAEKSKETNF